MNDSRERSLEQDTRQELTQKVLLSFARQIAVGMVTKFHHFIYSSILKRSRPAWYRIILCFISKKHY